MKLAEMGKLSIGFTLARIEAKPGEAFQEFELFTMQELTKETGNYGCRGRGTSCFKYQKRE